MSDHASVLFANEAFYIAFANRDLDAMSEVWTKAAAITCIHPGWLVLTDREEVMASWEAILAGPGSPGIFCEKAVAHVFGDTAYAFCNFHFEGDIKRLAETFVTGGRNTFILHRQNGVWKVIHYHESRPHTS